MCHDWDRFYNETINDMDEITEIRTRTASKRPYNEITEGIRAL